MTARKRYYFLILAIITFLLVTILINVFSSSEDMKEQIENSSCLNIENSKDKLRAETLVNDFYGDDISHTILDFKFNEQKSLLLAIVVFSNQDQSDESNVLIVTDVGTGVINVGGGAYDFKYLLEDGISLISEDTIALSFKDQQSGDIFDYSIQYILNNEKDIAFKVNSGIR